MSDIRKLYGPPGTGKTRALSDLALRAAQQFGPQRVAATTFTRSAAAELRERIATGLGLHLPSDPWARSRELAQRLPWVGTTHSIALKLAGSRRVLQSKDLSRFIKDMGGAPSIEDEEPDGYLWSSPGKDEVEAALSLYSMARHRMVPLGQAYAEAQWGFDGPSLSPMRTTHLCRAYEDFKSDIGKLDFEDMLEQGLSAELPVDVMLADEVQDNSPLLWTVLDRWGAGKLQALAGDPYQALYIWSGAEPRLFIEHEGDLHRLGSSHRLTQGAADRAQRTLREAGYTEEEWLGSWTGLASGEPRDRTEFWLARTGRLLVPVRRELEDAGTPYANLRGGGPLATKEADAFRVLLRLRTRGAADAASVALLAAHHSWVSKRARDRCKQAARDVPDEPWGIGEAETMLEISLDHAADGLSRGEYFERVAAQHGTEAFRYPPRVQVGTIHSAKGREADVVHLLDSWGTLPARALGEPQGRAAEGCVAYVALTRHRVRCVLEPAESGTPYPW